MLEILEAFIGLIGRTIATLSNMEIIPNVSIILFIAGVFIMALLINQLTSRGGA